MCIYQLLLAASKLLSTVDDGKTTRRVSGENGLLSENRKPFIESFGTQEQTYHHRKLSQAIHFILGTHSVMDEEILNYWTNRYSSQGNRPNETTHSHCTDF